MLFTNCLLSLFNTLHYVILNRSTILFIKDKAAL